LSDGDADTQIVSTALEYVNTESDVVVIANDTDVLVLLLFHYESGKNLYILSETGKNISQCWKISDIVTSTGDAIINHILFIHAWSGCDTTSAIFGQGKNFYEKVKVVCFSIRTWLGFILLNPLVIL